MAMSDRHLTELLAHLKTKPANGVHELEIRFQKLDRETFEQVYAAILADSGPEPALFSAAVVEKTVNAVSQNVYENNRDKSIQYIRSTTINGTTAVDTNFRSKVNVVRPVRIADFLPYTINLSIEDSVKQFTTRPDALIRFKLRVSHQLRGTPWRFDFTAVRGGVMRDFSGAKLQSYRDEMFADVPFPTGLPHEIDSYELEIEYVGDPSPGLAPPPTPDDITGVARRVMSYIDPQHQVTAQLSNEIGSIAAFVGKRASGSNQLKQVLNQVNSLSKTVYYAEVWPQIAAGRLFATPKLDGARCAIVLREGRCHIVRSNDTEEIQPARPVDPGKHYIIDAELLGGKYYAFELVAIDEKASAGSLSERLIQLSAAIELAASFVDIVAKDYVKLDSANLRTQIESIRGGVTTPTDGIIFSEDGLSYIETRHYKWKPYEDNTIDFLAVKCPGSLLGIKPYEVKTGLTLYLLFVGINRQMREKLGLGFILHYRTMFPDAGKSGGRDKRDATSATSGSNYMPIQFSTSADPIGYLFYSELDLDRQIVELGRNRENTEWVLRGTRPDRKVDKSYYGNDYRIAELTYTNFIDPFALSDLWTPSKSYFTKTATGAYMASNKYKRYVVSVLMKENISGAKWVIDLGAGRGGDLHRYQEIGVENALFTDDDPTAIAELISRKFKTFTSNRRHVRGWLGGDGATLRTDVINGIEYDKLVEKDVKSLTIHTLVIDLRTPAPDLVASTLRFGATPERVDGMVCNFALHYMCETVDSMRNLLTFVSRMLRVGGVFIFLVMDGRKVFDLLSEVKTGDQWSARDDPAAPPKYAITRKYTAKTLQPAGQTISVLLPFSDEMYDEPLCNVDAVISSARKVGLEIETDSNMLEMMSRFARADAGLAARLTDADKHYIGLHRYVTMRRV